MFSICSLNVTHHRNPLHHRRKSALITAACHHCMRHMTSSTMHSLCWLQVFSDVCYWQDSLLSTLLGCILCVCTVHVGVWLLISAGTEVLGGFTHDKVNKQRLKQTKKMEKISFLEAFLYNSWLCLTTWFYTISNYTYPLSLPLIKQVRAKGHDVKLLCWHKMSHKLPPLTLLIFKFINIHTATTKQCSENCNPSWFMGLEERNLYKDELLCLSALHRSCFCCKSPLPHLFALWLCIRMCHVMFQSLGWPSPLFLPQVSYCACLLACSFNFWRGLFLPYAHCNGKHWQ